MATEYVDAGQAVDAVEPDVLAGSAPPVTKGVTYERILNARSRAAELADLLRRLRRAALQPARPDQHGERQASSRPRGCSRPARSACTPASRRTRSRPPRSSSTGSCSSPAGTAGSGRSTPRTASMLWQYRHAIPFDVSLCCGNVNRGVAVAEGMVFVATLNAHIIALDAETGKKVWDQTYGDVRAGESATVAPLVVKDMVIVGSSGGEFGNRGHSDAFKLETGERVWRTLHGPEAGRARVRDLARRRRGVAARRRELLGHADVRRGPEPHLLRDRQPLPRLRRRRPRGRQPLHRLGCGRRRRHAARSRRTSSTPRTTCGTTTPRWSTSCSTSMGRSWRPTSTRTGSSTSWTAPNMYAGPRGAVRRPHRLGRGRREGQRDPAGLPGRGGRPGALLARPGRRQGVDARLLQPEDRAPVLPGAGRRRDGHPAPPRVQGEHPVLGRGRRGGPRGHRRLHQRVRPADRRREVALRQRQPMCASLLATAGDLVFGGEPTGEFNALDAETRRATSGSSSAAAATTRARARTASTAGSTSPRRPAGAPGPRASCPACSAPARAAR